LEEADTAIGDAELVVGAVEEPTRWGTIGRDGGLSI
jgi:hypothetical protein